MMESTKILIVDDEVEYRETYRILLEQKGFIVEDAGSAKEALEILSKEYFPIVITDVIMPGEDGFYLLDEIKKSFKELIEVIIVTGYGSIESAVSAMKAGALGYFIKSSNPDKLFSEIEKARRLIKYEVQQFIVNRDVDSKLFLYQSKNLKIQKILRDIETLSESTCNVLITGESGVGKEIFAKLIHDKSSRSKGVFLPTNCQAISENLLEDELFGHEKGAFTGANTQRIGRFEEASGGTMFLDEIGEITPSIQVKLLRVLDSRYIERIGSNKRIPVNFRLISATNKDLKRAIQMKEFREDLYYRINTVNIEIPPLRDRREDLEDMIDFFIYNLSRETKKRIKGIEPNTKEFLINYSYPGNIRELKNILERMIVLSRDGILRMEKSINNQKKNATDDFQLIPYKEAKKDFEINYIKNALTMCDNNISKTAEKIGLSRRQLFNKITEYNLK
ncbi:sigma-54-dependent transcriptional regulator [Maledivibacter halophilus]|uniref:Stage 0 sporulation protein A homolog n=1 Tax=Maledivibacter halophilus TaxID=36842 RepID=A0A1T5MDJ8_9FIRM|nr:sigma-54 dependent transcriptional regulator [Maledivibacter halophilus]SKC86292.1 DNA-binding transcriptional response regulator, NtrC family, contains REC, AAA-type ATPase, and a Fis-type DNA-binding domains [Maledivibacter halophilus]